MERLQFQSIYFIALYNKVIKEFLPPRALYTIETTSAKRPEAEIVTANLRKWSATAKPQYLVRPMGNGSCFL